MEVAKGPTGLGKGLAGILGDAKQQPRAPEVSSLLGTKAVRKAPEVRKLVSELGLRFISESFGSDGAILVRRENGDDLASVTSQLPDQWNGLDAFGFALAGRLWKTMDDGLAGAEQGQIAGRSVLFSKQVDSDGNPTAAAVVRGYEFDEDEQRTIARLLHSISAAASGEGFDVDMACRVQTEVLDGDDEACVTVRLRGSSDDREAIDVASSETTAAAQAATALCSEPLTVRFAGETIVSDTLVSLVVLRTGTPDEAGTPIFGLAVGAASSSLGAVEAVFRAARVLDADPFGTRVVK